MALKDCISALTQAGKVTKSQASKIREQAKVLENKYRASNKYSPEEVKARAEQDAVDFMFRDIKEREFKQAKHIESLITGRKTIKSHPDSHTSGVRGMLVKDEAIAGGAPPVERLADSIFAQSINKLNGFVEEFRSKVGGGLDRIWNKQNNEALRDVFRAKFGKYNKPKLEEGAAEAAQAIIEAENFIIDRIRAAGVPMKRLENYGLPTNVRPYKLRNVEKKSFVDFYYARADRARMVDADGVRMSDDKLKELIAEMYDTIKTGGANKSIEAVKAARGAGGIAGRAQQSRIFHFKDAESWLEWHDIFGEGDIFENIMEHLRDLAKDAALFERFGPKPEEAFKILNKEAQALDELKPKTPKNKFREKVKKFSAGAGADNQALFNYLSGIQTVTGGNRIANVFSTLRSLNVAAKLGKASISALADQAYLKAQADMLGASYGRIGKNFLKGMNVMSKEHRVSTRQLATHLGMVTDWAHQVAASGNRFTEIDVFGKSSRRAAVAADAVLRTTGLGAITTAGRSAFVIELNFFGALNAAKKFNELPSNFKRALKDYDISPKQWDAIRSSLEEIKGNKYVSHSLIKDRDAADAWLAMQSDMATRAVPEGGAEIRALGTGGQGPGTFRSEIGKNLFQFKNFPLTVMMTQIQRIMDPRVRFSTRMMYLANLLIYTTVLGTISQQLVDIVSGKEPRSFTDPGLWIDGLARGGGLGVVPDVVRAFANGQVSIKDTFNALGPVSGMASIVAHAAVSPHKPERFVRALKELSPKTWYTQLVMERYIWDQLQRVADPKAAKKFNRAKRRLKKNKDQEFFWAPGDTKPK